MIIENKTFQKEREFYDSSDIELVSCRFEGEEDGESAFKESRDIKIESCYFDLRYPFWHDTGVCISDTLLTPNCRAALWYSDKIRITASRLHGIKALRECNNVYITDTDIISPEFGWFCGNVHISDSTASGEYFMMRSKNMRFENLTLNGKYSFQYIENAVFENCILNTKDAFWHAKNVTVRNSTVNGEYLAWYAENITFESCRIVGTQPLCYCKGLRLISCEMLDADLAFERSEVEATITTPVISIKNPLSGSITLPAVGEMIRDYPEFDCSINLSEI